MINATGVWINSSNEKGKTTDEQRILTAPRGQTLPLSRTHRVGHVLHKLDIAQVQHGAKDPEHGVLQTNQFTIENEYH